MLKHFYEHLFGGLFTKNYQDPAYLLKKTGLFKRIGQDELDKLCQGLNQVEYPVGEVILNEGELGDHFYVLISGMVKVFTKDQNGHEIILAYLEHGAYFGEQALLEGTPGKRNASIMAMTDVKVLEISRSYIIKALNLDKKVNEVLKERGKKQLIQKLSNQLNLSEESRHKITQYLDGEITYFQDKQVIFTKGDPYDKAYFILDGKVNIYLQGTIDKPELLVELCPGQFFGELGVLNKTSRFGTAIANGLTKLLVISADTFLEQYQTNSEFQELINSRQRVYNIPQRGIVNIVDENFLGMKATNVTFHLTDRKTIIASQVIGKNIFKMAYTDTQGAQEIQYEDEGISRIVQVVQDKLVSISSIGEWNELGHVCKMLLDNVKVDLWQIDLFKQTGNFNVHYQDISEVICYCMRVTRGTIANAIRNGINDQEALSNFTGAGTVCGTCKPRIMEMLGRASWSIAHIEDVQSLTSDVRVYRIKLYDSKPVDYKPGQYIVIQALIDRHWVERAFTLTSIAGKDDYYEIVVKKKPEGYFTPWLFNHDNQIPFLRVSLPQGDFIFNAFIDRPAVFFAGGIGVTPFMAFIRSCFFQGSNRLIYMDYSAHTTDDLIFSEELKKAAHQSSITLHRRASLQQGRLRSEEIKEIVTKYPTADFYLCGPDDFQFFIRDQLESCQVHSEKIHLESFTKVTSPNDFVA